jgi:hypothetical protein
VTSSLRTTSSRAISSSNAQHPSPEAAHRQLRGVDHRVAVGSWSQRGGLGREPAR